MVIMIYMMYSLTQRKFWEIISFRVIRVSICTKKVLGDMSHVAIYAYVCSTYIFGMLGNAKLLKPDFLFLYCLYIGIDSNKNSFLNIKVIGTQRIV